MLKTLRSAAKGGDKSHALEVEICKREIMLEVLETEFHKVVDGRSSLSTTVDGGSSSASTTIPPGVRFE